jgi:hypothetical protein
MEHHVSEKLELDSLSICRNLASFYNLDIYDTIDISVTPGTMADSFKQAGSTVPQRGTRIVRHLTAAARNLSSDTTSSVQTRSASSFTYRSQQRHVSNTGLSLFVNRFLVIGIFLSLSFCAIFFVMMIGKKRWPL